MIDDGTETAGPTLTWHSASSLAIIAANLVPLWGVIFEGWSVFSLFLLFWLETVVIVLANSLRILFARPGDLELWLKKIFYIPLNWFQYGLLAAAHGAVILTLFGQKEGGRIRGDGNLLDGVVQTIGALNLWPQLAAIAVAHLCAFFGYILQGEYRRSEIRALMDQPLGRALLLHLTLIAGGYLAMSFGSPLWAMLVLVILKLGLDLLLHLGLVEIRSRE